MPSSKTIAPYWKSDCGRVTIYVGDCLQVMSQLDREVFHAVVTDPPYGLKFMNHQWDAPWKNDASIKVAQDGMDESHPFRDRSHKVSFGSDSKKFQQWFHDRTVVMLDVAKPGAHLLSFGGTRMHHRMFCAIEDAGWEIRDTIAWVYATGFPKGKDIGKGIDDHMGAKRVVKISKERLSPIGGNLRRDVAGSGGYGFGEVYGDSDPVTAEAKQWDGWNSTLKPAIEPICVAQKQFGATLAECVLKNGCGGINVDGCLIGDGETRQTSTGGMANKASPVYGEFVNTEVTTMGTTEGRWPTNLIHDGSEEAIAPMPPGAARYFYSAKASSSDRPHGKDSLHPTVKPLDLMRYLIRLVCARGGHVLDPFMGSGSTGCAALLEGTNFTGIELSREYADIAVGKIKLALEQAPPAEVLKTYSGRRQSVSTRAGTPPPPKKVERGAGRKKT